jgi:hypothetical protein
VAKFKLLATFEPSAANRGITAYAKAKTAAGQLAELI